MNDNNRPRRVKVVSAKIGEYKVNVGQADEKMQGDYETIGWIMQNPDESQYFQFDIPLPSLSGIALAQGKKSVTAGIYDVQGK